MLKEEEEGKKVDKLLFSVHRCLEEERQWILIYFIF